MRNLDHTASTRAARLRQLLFSDSATVLMEAHNGLSAKLAEEAGFEAIWASGLAISAALGVRDANEASSTDILNVLEFMTEACGLPILLDGDTGYGNFNKVRRLVRKLEQRHVAGVCLEDKLFPKMNSFIKGERQKLAEVEEFCGKIRAAKDTQKDPDFSVVARTEAFIAGWGLEEALLRASAYAEAGADAILVHSKRRDGRDIFDFMRKWSIDLPIVIVPTKYPQEPLERFVEIGVKNIIFANQGIRAVIAALQSKLQILAASKNLLAIEEEIAPIDEVFRLQNIKELADSEEIYLPSGQCRCRALVLAATRGDFGSMVDDKPKAMLKLHGKPILAWHLDSFRRQGIGSVCVVRGYQKQAVDLEGIEYFDNDRWAETGEIFSLDKARSFFAESLLICYGDVLYDESIVRRLLDTMPEGIMVAVDAGWKLRGRRDPSRDLVLTSGIENPLGDRCRLDAIGANISEQRATGEWIGLLYVGAPRLRSFSEALQSLRQEHPETWLKGDIPQLINYLVDHGETVSAMHTFGHWQDIDEIEDLHALRRR